MGSLFRSEKMCLTQVFLQTESAYNCVAELGELGLVQFKDLSPHMNAFQRKYVNEVRRCDEMERKLRYVEKEIKGAKVEIAKPDTEVAAPPPREMIDLEANFEKIEVDLKEVNSNHETLQRNYLELTEHRHVLRNTTDFFAEAELFQHDREEEEARSTAYHRFGIEDGVRQMHSSVKFGFVAGVLGRERVPAFEKTLWRVCHGNVFLRHSPIEEQLEDPSTGDEVFKHVFIAFFQGEQLGGRVKKVCEGFHATLYPCPENAMERSEMCTGVAKRLEDLKRVLVQTVDHRQRVLASAAVTLWVWFVKVRKLKAIYHMLNMCNVDVTYKCLIAECWCPESDLGRIRNALQLGNEKSGSTVPSILNIVETKQEPPTYNKTNKFTSAFQGIVDAYGVANYREINPAPYTIITFPFLFAVMFGDAGHGTLMALFGAWMVIREAKLQANKTDNEIWNVIFGGRYIILLMGLFSIYCGVMYNDFFSKSTNVFGSSWEVSKMENYTDSLLNQTIDLQLDPVYAYSGIPYPYGLDPVWQFSKNKLNFLNPFKMRLSIIFGVIHMMFGIHLSLLNHIYRGHYSSIFLEFIPQLLFLVLIFGYLVALIVIKWVSYDGLTSEKAPSIINMFIFMFLFTNKPELYMYPYQYYVQMGLVVTAVFMVPVLLFGKPVYRLIKHRTSKHDFQPKMRFPTILMQRVSGHEDSVQIMVNDSLNSQYQSESSSQGGNSVEVDAEEEYGKDSDEKFEFSEELVHQSIHTIEYCLGCISNTASYLRLWALSLAHAELSEVLWTMVLKNGLGIQPFYGSVVIFATFAGFAVLTVGILLLMEGLSAFLHALRLHWVEFQNKFYTGEGHVFLPFSFTVILEAEEE
ncbi:V-type proton ATPase 116 kDa subunit a-like isoform X1 [Asterias rubens]|uniref:V-type proton ATPase 116 kDa subunit a-like isoform X1 n=1 Tax=Asterias rubens TaxID=7604 RepID=UPI00145586C1|nr:V-type proton ATPase 116 kDa subunit a-like isoform X1 [Asterias rubens]